MVTEIITDAIIELFTVFLGVMLALISLIYRKLNKRVEDIENKLESIEDMVIGTKHDTRIQDEMLFGRKEDSTSIGLSKKIQNLRKRLEKLIDALHDEESLEFERDDLE